VEEETVKPVQYRVVNLTDLFPIVTSSPLLDSKDARVSRFAICFDSICSNQTEQFEGIKIVSELAVFITGAPQYPTTLFIGALHPNGQKWSTLPVTHEICGYEKLMAVN
jgi:hypothetical protein